MQFRIKDLFHAWEWIQQRRLRTVTEFGAKQPKLGANQPCPHLRSVAYYPATRVGNSVPITVSAQNLGAWASGGGITVSFPDVPRNGDGAYIEVVKSSSGEFILREAGDELLSSDEGNAGAFVARNLVREVHIYPWDPGEVLEFHLAITPSRAGTFSFLVTSWAATEGWQRILRTPAVKDTKDQQNHAVFPYVISVSDNKL